MTPRAFLLSALAGFSMVAQPILAQPGEDPVEAASPLVGGELEVPAGADIAPPISDVPTAAGESPPESTGWPLGIAPPGDRQLVRWGGGASVVFLLCMLLLLRRRRALRPRLFPLTAPRSRFSAPHSGGNNAMISFGDVGGK